MSAMTSAVIEFKPRRTPPARKYRGSDRPSLSIDMLKAVLTAATAAGRREAAMFVLAFSHGLRVSELAGLRVSDVDLPNGKILIRRLKGSNDSWQGICADLFGFDERAVIAAWLTERQWVPGADSDLLFPSRKMRADGSRQLDRAQLHRIFGRVCDAAGVPEERQHLHALRHSCGQLLFNAGVRLEEIQHRLGHRSIASTSIYARPTSDSVNRAVSAAFSS